MIAAGIDIGGTKIEVQLFDKDWTLKDQKRVVTPGDYDGLIAAIAGEIDWVAQTAGDIPVGVGSAGLVNPQSGLALTSNLPATGKPLVRDIEARVGHGICFLNDCRAMTLSEAVFGAGVGARTVVGLILGTGVGGGVAVDGQLLPGSLHLGGEFGHMTAPARIVHAADLPIVTCGCGRIGCIETLISGPGLTRLAAAKTGATYTPAEIARLKADQADLAAVWDLWCDLVAELILAIAFTVDPDVVVIGGGLSQIARVADDLQARLSEVQFKNYPVPAIRLAEGGDASGARGAAYFAWGEARNG